jgi:hypothetical protein
MQVNHALKVKYPCERDDALSALNEAFDGTGITFRPQDGPLGAAFPTWVSIIFSTQHGSWERLVTEIWSRVRRANLDRYLEEWPWAGTPPPCAIQATAGL